MTTLVEEIIRESLNLTLLQTYRDYVGSSTPDYAEMVNIMEAKRLLAEFEKSGIATNDTALAIVKIVCAFKSAADLEFLFYNGIQTLFHLSGMILEKNYKA